MMSLLMLLLQKKEEKKFLGRFSHFCTRGSSIVIEVMSTFYFKKTQTQKDKLKNLYI